MRMQQPCLAAQAPAVGRAQFSIKDTYSLAAASAKIALAHGCR